MTVLEVIQRSADFLARRGVDSPRLQVELLLAHVLGMPRLKLYLNFERVLTEAELDLLRGLVKRRGGREPLQHILGSTSFCGREMKVTRDVLVPRPETESLAELAWQYLATLGAQPSTVLDFGTGSGCLAITLAIECPHTRVHALDISEAALVVARQNAARQDVADRIQLHESDGLVSLPKSLRFNLLVGNPPYIPSAEIAGLQPEVRDHDPRSALDGGWDGLDFYRRLAEEAAPRMAAENRVMLEFGDDQETRVCEIFTGKGWIIVSVAKDYSGRSRILIARWPN